MEIILHIVLEPILELLMIPVAEIADAPQKSRLPKWCRVLFAVLISILIFGALLVFVLGIFFLIIGGSSEDKTNALIMLFTGLGALVVYAVIIAVRLNIKKRRKKLWYKPTANTIQCRAALRRIVHVVVDRPIGSVHPEHTDVVFGLNYGFVPEAVGVDGEAQDAYVLGVDEPISEFDGVVVAVIHRRNDNEYKWVVAPRGYEPTDEEIAEKTNFQEKFFDTVIVK